MAALTVLHLSDFHFSLKKWPDASLIIDGLIVDLKEQAKANWRADIAIFSGDLFQAGGADMPVAAFEKDVLSPVLAAAGLTFDELFICPGNHDIDREWVRANQPIQAGLLTQLGSRDELNKFADQQLATPSDAYWGRLEAYSAYKQKFAASHRVESTPFSDVYKFTTASKVSVGIACFNTAWLSTGEEGDIDRGKLLLPERAIHAAAKTLTDCAIKIAVHHHPLDYLADFCRFDARALLFKNFNVICYGHMHQAMPLMTRSSIGENVSSEAGALYTWRQYYNGYCFIRVDTDARTTTFKHRKWLDSPAYKFGAAEELSNGESVFHWGNAQQAAIVRDLIDVNKVFRPFLEEQANEHMLSSHTTTSAPNSFEELYVPVPISAKTHDGESPFASAEYLSVDSIIERPGVQVVFGNREAGKTTLAYSIALTVAQSEKAPIKAPIIIDLEKTTAGANVIQREAKKCWRSRICRTACKRF
ncbi:metallophosphoesterase family protein [Sphingomonas panacisoli]|uniref:metallophosphoesterase family protein n=1 Tax=Sphingomonas panacisoli TaxID=1813879 RepID=UPI001644ACF2|nr:metallophosphoesterase [Sphingomonas panacisoli]